MGLRQWLRTPPIEVAPLAPPVDKPSALARRVAELEERMDYLEEALNRLRGKVTGAQRGQKGTEASEVDAKQENTQQPELDRWQLLSQAKKRRGA